MRDGFKYRMGIEEQPFLQVEEITEELSNDIWNVFYAVFYEYYQKLHGDVALFEEKQTIQRFFQAIHMMQHKPLDEYKEGEFLEKTKELLFKCWYEDSYEWIEFVIKAANSYKIGRVSKFISLVNDRLEYHNSAYRIHDDQVIMVNNKEELAEVKMVAQNSVQEHLTTVQEHLNTALKHLKPNGDLRNCVKESISMVESVARIIAPSENTLGKALKKLDKEGTVNSLLNESNNKLYNYSNGPNGIRHALMDPNVDLSVEDARYFLISCSAFTNYLFEKGRKNNIFDISS